MNRRIFWLAVLMTLSMLCIGCQKSEIARPLVRITGDLESWTTMDEIDDVDEYVSISYQNESIEAVEMQQLIQQLSPIGESFDVILKAEDGFMVRLSGSSLADTHFGFSEASGWVYVSEKHPVNSRIKGVEEMIFVSTMAERMDCRYGLNLIDKETDIHYTMGELMTMERQVLAQVDGVSSLETAGESLNVTVMKEKYWISLESLAGHPVSSLLLMDSTGEHQYLFESGGRIELADNQVHYVSGKTGEIYRDIEGIWIDPPTRSVMDAYHDARYYLDQGDKVMILFIDGFSYAEYLQYVQEQPESFLASLEPFEQASSVFKPVTNAGYAAMVTGEPPNVNGILDRSYREVQVETIFDYAEGKSLNHFVIEGNTSIISLNTELVLSNDTDQDGYTDDQIFENALSYLEQDYDLGLVHFHSVDDLGHATGNASVEVMDRIDVIDGYAQSLSSMWEGKVIITADHGMHKTPEGGSHGEFRVDDLLIPYQIISGGKIQ